MTRRAYTYEAIAEETGKTAEYIKTLVHDGKLAAKRLGKTPLVLADEYESFLEALPDA